MILQYLKDYLTQEVDDWARIGTGHFVGAVAILMSVPTLFLAYVYVRDFFTDDVDSRIAVSVLLMICSIITVFFYRIAYRLITNKKL